jgi:hypothetical protein
LNNKIINYEYVVRPVCSLANGYDLECYEDAEPFGVLASPAPYPEGPGRGRQKSGFGMGIFEQLRKER